jgi:hypothetical protein
VDASKYHKVKLAADFVKTDYGRWITSRASEIVSFVDDVECEGAREQEESEMRLGMLYSLITTK